VSVIFLGGEKEKESGIRLDEGAGKKRGGMEFPWILRLSAKGKGKRKGGER